MVEIKNWDKFQENYDSVFQIKHRKTLKGLKEIFFWYDDKENEKNFKFQKNFNIEILNRIYCVV